MSDNELFTGSSIKDEIDLKKCMTQIEFGYLDNEENVHYEIDSNFRQGYVLQTPRLLMKSFVGTCFDEVELIRKFFDEKNIYNESYFIMAKGAGNIQNHAFVIFQNEDMWGWFENYWKEFEGIHYYISKERLLRDVYDKFVSKCGRISQVALYHYDMPNYGINYDEFIKHCMKGTLVHTNRQDKGQEKPKIPNIFMAKSIKNFDINEESKE